MTGFPLWKKDDSGTVAPGFVDEVEVERHLLIEPLVDPYAGECARQSRFQVGILQADRRLRGRRLSRLRGSGKCGGQCEYRRRDAGTPACERALLAWTS
ncbi:MAG: hypothetical protein WDO73_27150 [Ignavibacteriota bacterium]